MSLQTKLGKLSLKSSTASFSRSKPLSMGTIKRLSEISTTLHHLKACEDESKTTTEPCEPPSTYSASSGSLTEAIMSLHDMGQNFKETEWDRASSASSHTIVASELRAASHGSSSDGYTETTSATITNTRDIKGGKADSMLVDTESQLPQALQPALTMSDSHLNAMSTRNSVLCTQSHTGPVQHRGQTEKQ